MEIILFGLLAVMLVFMFMNSRKRQRQLKLQQEEKAARTIPGAKVLLQGGLYGTIVSYDPVDLDKPAEVEIAPGVVIEVHSQSILRVVDPLEPLDDETDLDAEDDLDLETTPAVTTEDGIESITVETPEETQARLERNNDN